MKKYVVEVRKSLYFDAESFEEAEDLAKEDLVADIEAWGASETAESFSFAAAEAEVK